MKTRFSLIAVFLSAAILLFASTASAAIPHLMNFQGKATDKAGAPLSGTYNLTFRIYDAETGGAAKWSETQTGVQITNGIFQVQLGSVTALTLSFDVPYWISLEINTDGEMSPRTRLASVPYAYAAQSLSEAPVIPFYRKGFDIVSIDFNSIKISAGVMDLVGKMFASTIYSDPLRLECLTEPKNQDWIHGSKTPNSVAYVYAFNNAGQIAFKFSDEAPTLSDYYGNTAQQPFLYKRYPETSEGVYYRYIGQIQLDDAGNPGLISNIEQIASTVRHPTSYYVYGTASIYHKNDSLVSGAIGSVHPIYTKKKETKILAPLSNVTINVSFKITASSNNGPMYHQLYKNGTAIPGTEVLSESGFNGVYAYDVTGVNQGDLIQVYLAAKWNSAINPTVSELRINGAAINYDNFPNMGAETKFYIDSGSFGQSNL
ncbi:MAG: hypothetical protein PHS46_02470 [Candidatus Omnitrophica bacterium]|nr:hypothetical protein [Candidatus Omnitrophota bacterium]